MPNLLFFSRVALICNACFLITFALHYFPSVPKELVPGTIVIMGNVLAIVVNVIVNLACISIALAARSIRTWVPPWLLATNFIFFVVQIILLIK